MPRTGEFLPLMMARGHLYEVTAASPEEWLMKITKDPDIPQDADELIRYINMVHGNEEPYERSATSIMRKFSIGLANPYLSETDLTNIDTHFNAVLGNLTDYLESTYFYVKYTTTGDDAVTLAVAQATATILDQHYLLYRGLFGKDPLQTSVENGKEIVEIRKINYDGFVSLTGPLTLSNASMTNDHNRPWTTAHELFHTVEFAFGLDSANHDDKAWFSEGAANWAAVFAMNGVVDDYWNDFRDYQTTSIFDESYDAFPLWIFLNGFRVSNPQYQSNVWNVQLFLETYETGGDSMAALQKVLLTALAPENQDTLVPIFVARYTAAKAVNSWRGAGNGYNRSGIMPFAVNLTSYSTGDPSPPPSIPYTGTESIASLGQTKSFDNKILTAGTANLYKITISPGVFTGKVAVIQLSKAQGQSPLTACMLSATDHTQNDISRALSMNSSRQTGTEILQLNDNSTNAIYISVVDGRLGGTTTGDITYTLEVKITDPNDPFITHLL